MNGSGGSGVGCVGSRVDDSAVPGRSNWGKIPLLMELLVCRVVSLWDLRCRHHWLRTAPGCICVAGLLAAIGRNTPACRQAMGLNSRTMLVLCARIGMASEQARAITPNCRTTGNAASGPKAEHIYLCDLRLSFRAVEKAYDTSLARCCNALERFQLHVSE